MGTKIEYVDSNHLHATNYIRNSKAIAVLWAIFTICYAIISAVAFFTPGNYFHESHFHFSLTHSHSCTRSPARKINERKMRWEISPIQQIAWHDFSAVELRLIDSILVFLKCHSKLTQSLNWITVYSRLCHKVMSEHFLSLFFHFVLFLPFRMGWWFRFRECRPVGSVASVSTWRNIGQLSEEFERFPIDSIDTVSGNCFIHLTLWHFQCSLHKRKLLLFISLRLVKLHFSFLMPSIERTV